MIFLKVSNTVLTQYYDACVQHTTLSSVSNVPLKQMTESSPSLSSASLLRNGTELQIKGIVPRKLLINKSDLVMNYAQKVLKLQFLKVKGFQSTLLQDKKKKARQSSNSALAWKLLDCCATSINASPGCVRVYDLVFDIVNDHTAQLITNLFGSLAKPTAVVIPKHLGSNDCGVYAIANAAAICFGKDPAALHFNQTVMKLHLVECLE